MQAALPTEIDVLCLLHSQACSFHRFLAVVQMLSQCSPSFISDVSKTMWIFNLSQSHSARVSSSARSLDSSILLGVFASAYCRMDFGVKILGRFFSRCGVLSAQRKSVNHFTALQGAHAKTAGFRLKLTSVFGLFICVFDFEVHSESSGSQFSDFK